MSIEKLYPRGTPKAGRKNGGHIGFVVYVRVFPEQIPIAKRQKLAEKLAAEGKPPLEPNQLVQTSRYFRLENGENKAAAEQWERAMLHARAELAGDHTRGMRSNVVTTRRAVDDLAQRYLEHSDFAKLQPRTQVRVKSILESFLAWNRRHGRPYADLFTEDLANEYIKLVYSTHEGKGRALYLMYVKKIFELEVRRKHDKAISDNPFPKVREPRQAKSTIPPRAFTAEELRAFKELAPDALARMKNVGATYVKEHAPEYDAMIWTLLANTGLRTGELDSLLTGSVIFTAARPSDIAIEDHLIPSGKSRVMWRTKNGRQRRVPLNNEAMAAMEYLLLHEDESGFVIRRDWIGRPQAFLRSFEMLKRVVIEKYPHLKNALSGSGPSTRTTPHTFRKTCATNLLRAGVSVKAVADILGDEMDTVLEYYAALLNQDLREAMHRLDGSAMSVEHTINGLKQTHGRDYILKLLE